MIGYKMGSSPAGVYTIAKASLMKTPSMDEKYDMVVNMATLFVGVLSGGQVSWTTLNPRTRNLTSRESQLEIFF